MGPQELGDARDGGGDVEEIKAGAVLPHNGQQLAGRVGCHDLLVQAHAAAAVRAPAAAPALLLPLAAAAAALLLELAAAERRVRHTASRVGHAARRPEAAAAGGQRLQRVVGVDAIPRHRRAKVVGQGGAGEGVACGPLVEDGRHVAVEVRLQQARRRRQRVAVRATRHQVCRGRRRQLAGRWRVGMRAGRLEAVEALPRADGDLRKARVAARLCMGPMGEACVGSSIHVCVIGSTGAAGIATRAPAWHVLPSHGVCDNPGIGACCTRPPAHTRRGERTFSRDLRDLCKLEQQLRLVRRHGEGAARPGPVPLGRALPAARAARAWMRVSPLQAPCACPAAARPLDPP